MTECYNNYCSALTIWLQIILKLFFKYTVLHKEYVWLIVTRRNTKLFEQSFTHSFVLIFNKLSWWN